MVPVSASLLMCLLGTVLAASKTAPRIEPRDTAASQEGARTERAPTDARSEMTPTDSARIEHAQSRPPVSEQAGSGQADSARPVAEIRDWRALVTELKIGGMARMLADHCELTRFEGNVVELSVPEAHRHLSEQAYNEKLQAILREHFGRPLRLKIEVGGSGNTPAAQEDRENRQKLDQAIEAIDTDPFVRELVENLDARVIDDSIKPV